jgi:hypothetical protein
MKLALVFVKRDSKLPTYIAIHVKRILGTDTTRNAGGQEGDKDITRDALIAAFTKRYKDKC